MLSHVVDSSALIDAFNGKRQRLELLCSLLVRRCRIGYSPVSVAEIYTGVRPSEETKVRDLLDALYFLDVTWEIARRAGKLRQLHLKKGKRLSLADATIGATTLAHRATWLTDNVRDFPMPDLKLYPLP